MNDLYLIQKNNISYPPNFLSSDQNDIKEIVSELFHFMRLDNGNYGTESWNPLGKYIMPGNTVLIKPNLVKHANLNSSVPYPGLDCLITNPSVIKVICDFCLVALKGEGKIIIGDSPMQGCEFDLLLKNSGLNRLIDHYKCLGINCVSLKDFRSYESKIGEGGVITSRSYTGSEGILVSIGNKSVHREGDYKYCVSDYDSDEVKQYHNANTHDYYVSKDALSADVIINLCKPKTHRLAGFTGCMKNMVGIVFDKVTLPHYVAGSKNEQGDSYKTQNRIKKIAEKLCDKQAKSEKYGKINTAIACRYAVSAIRHSNSLVGKEWTIGGAWYGNDTIWRTVCDLNLICKYADKSGIIQNNPQRKILNICDMVIAGEGKGPVAPTPKQLGMIMAGEDSEIMDIAICKLMGFYFKRIPLINYLLSKKANDPSDIIINSVIGNEKITDTLQNCRFSEEWRFVPYPTWSEAVE